jgi:hypothetical protein
MFAGKTLRCDCGSEVRAFDDVAFVDAIRRHAWEAHDIEFSVELALDVASEKQGDMSFGAASPIVELNDAAANDIQPNVRKDGREIVFSSNRAGGLGGQDIWSATRPSVDDPWSAPANLGSNVNTALGESRPALSWDAQQLLFGRAGPVGTGEGGTGASDIYVTTRKKAGN